MIRLRRYQRTDITLQGFLSPHCLPFAVELHRRRIGQLAVMVTTTGRTHFGVIGTHPDVDEEVWIDAGGACPMSKTRRWRFTGNDPIDKITRFDSIRDAQRRIRDRDGQRRVLKPRVIYAADPRRAVDELLAGRIAKRQINPAH